MSENDAGFEERKARREQIAGTWERLSAAGTGSFLPRPGPGDALLGSRVRVICGKCRRKADHMELRIRGWTLHHDFGVTGPDSHRWDSSSFLDDGTLTYACRCKSVHPVDVAALQAAAAVAWKAERDLLLGAPRFGLPHELRVSANIRIATESLPVSGGMTAQPASAGPCSGDQAAA